jgi:hypothetical protein
MCSWKTYGLVEVETEADFIFVYDEEAEGYIAEHKEGYSGNTKTLTPDEAFKTLSWQALYEGTLYPCVILDRNQCDLQCVVKIKYTEDGSIDYSRIQDLLGKAK